MHINTNLFRIIKNLFSRKKIAEAQTVVAEIQKEKIPKKSIGGNRFTKTKFTKSFYIKKKLDRIQGRSRNINHKKAA